MSIKTVTRYDAPEKLRVIQTEEGFKLTSGKIAKPGIMVYVDLETQREIRELVDEDVLTDDLSNATLIEKPLTMEHPAEDVTPDTWQQLAHGNVANAFYEPEHSDGPGLYARIAVKSKRALMELDNPIGKQELSPGYSVKVDDIPGTHPEFGDYDTKQIAGTRRYNHVALTEGARGGRDLVIRKDSAMERSMAIKEGEEPKNKQDDMDEKPKQDTEEEGKKDAEPTMKDVMDALNSMGKRLDNLEKAPKKDATDEDEEDKKDEEHDDQKKDMEEDKAKKQDSLKTYYKERKRIDSLAAHYSVTLDEDDSNQKASLAVLKSAGVEVDRKDAAQITGAIVALYSQMKAQSPYADWGQTLMETPTVQKQDSADDFDPNAAFLNSTNKQLKR